MRERLERILRDIAEQDGQLRAAQARLDPADTLTIPHAALHRLEELCTPRSRPHREPAMAPWTALRG